MADPTAPDASRAVTAGTARRGLLRRDPLWWFALCGAALFALYAGLTREPVEPVVLTDAALRELAAGFEQVTGAPPNAAQEQQLIDEFYRAEVLYREALRRELYRSDASVRELMIERLQLDASRDLPEPDDAALVNFYTDGIERYYAEATISFSQHFFRDRPADEQALLAALNAGEAVNSDAPPRGSAFPDYGESMIRGLFGQPILEQLRLQPKGVWAAPQRSPDGWHFFRVSARKGARLLPYARVRQQVLADYQTAQLDARLDAYVDELRSRFPLQRAP